MSILLLVFVGIITGLFGGLLGIGGSIVLIPALVLIGGENQHLYQAAAMIVNFFVASTACIVHRKADAVIPSVIKFLVPAAVISVFLGVAISNTALFSGRNSIYLARLFGLFMIYVIVYNVYKSMRPPFSKTGVSFKTKGKFFSALCGVLSGIPAGLLGVGGGVICVPSQQLLLKLPLKNAISNSAAMITAVAFFGAIYKNITLGQHNIQFTDSLWIAVTVTPTAIIGSAIGSRLVHILPAKFVRIAFIILAAFVAFKLLTIS